MIFENLTEEEAYLVALLLDESGIDQAEFAMIDETSWDHEKDEQGDGCFRAWPFQVPWFRCKARKQIDAGCIAEGHKVLTSEGWKPIELVRVGDMVLTHRNRWRPVTDVIPNGRKEVVSVSVHGSALNVRLTSNHQFWSRDARRASKPKDGHKRKKLSDAEWKSPEDWIWNDGSQVMTTHLASPASALPSLDFDRFLKPAYASGRQNFIEDTLNEDWLWLYGLYIAEGSVFDDGQMCRIQWDIHRNEVEDVSSRLDRLGLNFSVSFNKKDLGARVSMHSRPLGEWLAKYGGLGCRNKSIAPWVLGLEEKYRKAVFDGILYGDGHLKKPDVSAFELSTTSHDLVLSFRLLAQSLGYTFSAWHSPAPSKPVLIAGREVFSGDSYGVSVQPLAGQKTPRVIIDDGMAWVAPYGFDPAGEANVWDLEVEEDSSFIVEGLVVHNSRSAGKSLSIKLRAFAFPFVAPGEEMVITAPEGNHLDLVTDNVETLYTNCWLAKAMIAPGRGGIKHRPFVINFASGGRIVGRIPQRDGKGVKGIHPLWLEHDEASDYPEAGWIELTETVKEQNPNARWRAHGVTRGVGGGFDARISGESEDAGWVVHRLPAMLRPNWTDEERKRKIAEYGSVDNVDYRRNILGLPGDSNSPLFPLWKIFACVDKGKPTEDGRTNDLTYAEDEYYYVKLDDAQLREVGEVGDLLELPLSHRRYSNFWIGMDVGWTTSPSVIVVFAEVRTPKSNEPKLKLLSRIVMYRFDSTAQVDAICEVMEFYRPLAFAMDKGGAGQPLLTQLQDRVKQNPDLRFLLDRIKGYDFGEKIIVGFDEAVKIDPHDPNGWKEAAIRRLVRDASIDAVRSFIGAERMVLPFDKELINELQVVPKNINKAIMDEYGKPVRKTGMHSLDAIRFACLAQEQNVIEQMVATHEQTWTAPQMILL